MEYTSLVDKLKPLQLLSNLQIAGIIHDIPTQNIEEWANKILDENKELFNEQSHKDFINLVVYGK